MNRTQSSTPLDRISVEIDPSGMLSHIWLRANIEEVVKTEGEVSYTVYEADEVYMTIPGICTAESIEPMFDTLWTQSENSDASISERLSALEAKMANATAAIARNTLDIARNTLDIASR